MKILITLLVYFFSSSVLAGDNLAGKKLYCIGDPKEVKNYAFIFETENQVKIYETYANNTYRTLTNIKYRTEIDEIIVGYSAKIKPPNEWLGYYYIDRKSLYFIFDPTTFLPKENRTDVNKIIKLSECEITSADPLKIIINIAIKQIENIEKNNKI